MIDNLITTLLMFAGNEATNLSKKEQINFLMLIIQITRIKYGVRWHEYNRECPCQPECSIKELLKSNELKEFLVRERVFDTIMELLEKPINKDKTVFGQE